MASIDPNAKKATAQPKDAGFSGRALDVSSVNVRKYHSDANVIDAATLRVNDQPRFQKYHDKLKNADEDLAEEVLRHIRPGNNKDKARQWMTENIGSPPGERNAFTLLELGEIALVAIAFTMYGKDDRASSEQRVNYPLHSYELRSKSQQQYREQSRSTQKDGKDTAHYLGLDMVVKLNRDLPQDQRVSSVVLREVLNDSSNLRLVKLQTNRGLHARVDGLLLRIYNGETVRFTSEERQRVAMIIDFCQSDRFQQSMLDNRGFHLYDKIRGVMNGVDRGGVPPGKQKLWDLRYDKRALRPCTTNRDPPRAEPKANDRSGERATSNKSEWVTEEATRERASRGGGSKYQNAIDDQEAYASKTSSSTTPSRQGTRDNARDDASRAGGSSTPRASPPSAQTQHPQAKASTTNAKAPPKSTDADKVIHVGPRGGRYTMDANGKKRYLKD